MNEKPQPQTQARRTPEDASEFEREQLRFFLSRGDAGATLASINPSLAWLPMLWKMNLVRSDTQLAQWVERNFEDPNAVREVVANLRFFTPETANVLEFRLNSQMDRLSPVLVKCWRLIIRNMRTLKHGAPQNEWYEVAPCIARGDTSADTLRRVADALRPTLSLDKRSFYGEDEPSAPDAPSDLMSIKYVLDDGLSGEEVLAAWPENASADADDRLLATLSIALMDALEDAKDVGVDSGHGYGITDYDVPSVAKHEQNSYRSGFYPIVRVIADLWERLVKKSPAYALAFVDQWTASEFRLMRRLALFAAANPVVSPELAADILMKLPQAELFLTSSTVEVFRLIRARWKEFSSAAQLALLHRFVEGPPLDWFNEGTDMARRLDRCRFDILGDMEREGFELSPEARDVLADIRTRWPQWELRPANQAGFHIWLSSGEDTVGNAATLDEVSDEALVTTAEKIVAASDFFESDVWNALCLSDPDRAARGLAVSAGKGHWPPGLWRQLLWARKEYLQATTRAYIAQALLEWPALTFGTIAVPASSWIEEQAKALDDTLLWPLWDRIAITILSDTEEPAMNDVFTDALNSPAGRLVEVLIKKLASNVNGEAIPTKLRERLDKMVSATGRVGKLARVRLAAEVSLLFQRAPIWTAERMIPLFDWSSPDAPDVWSARKYSNYIGSPELFGLTKRAFLELFSRSDTPEEDVRVFSEWLTAIMIANQAKEADYPITATEARTALRRAGVKALSSVGHRLTSELGGGTAAQRADRWRKVVGPVFQSIWPLDVELQTSATTYKLTHLLRSTGDAFPEAADVIVPFIQPEERRSHSTVFSIAEAPEEIYEAAPSKVLDLMVAVVGDASPGSVYALGKALERIRTHDPALADTRKFQKLLSYAA